MPWRPSGCDNEYATNLANAAPPIIWQDCGSGFPGCQRIVPIWAEKSSKGEYAVALQTAPQLFKSGSTLRLSIHYPYGSLSAPDLRKAIYDENWNPIGAWRGKECGGNLLQWTAKHVCFAIVNVGDKGVQALLNPGDVTGAPLIQYDSTPAVPLGCNEELFTSSTFGGSPIVRDLASGSELLLPPPPSGVEIGDPRLAGEYLLFQRLLSGPVMDGWIWKRPNVIEKLVDPGGEVIYDIRSDGKTLVWVQTQSKDIEERAPGDLWTSPFSPVAPGIQPTKRRSLPASSLVASMKAAGDGWYALVEQPIGSKDRYLHVYRLSDARHWQVVTPPDVRPTDVIFIDSEEVWFTGMTLDDSYNTIIRQKLSTLGPGD